MKTMNSGRHALRFSVIFFFILIARNLEAQTGTVKTEAPEAQMSNIITEHFRVLNIQDNSKRLEAMNHIYRKDFHIIDTYFEHFNYRDWNNTVDVTHNKFPGATFSITEITPLNNVAKATWKLGDSLLGENIFIFRKGKIATIIAFVTPTGK